MKVTLYEAISLRVTVEHPRGSDPQTVAEYRAREFLESKGFYPKDIHLKEADSPSMRGETWDLTFHCKHESHSDP